MAKSNKVQNEIQPLHVGDVNGTPIYLSPRTQRDIELVPAGEARESFKAAKVAAATKAEEGRQKYLSQRDDLRIVETDRGFIAVNGTGTSQSGIFTAKQMLEFCKRVKEAEKLAKSMLARSGQSTTPSAE